MDLGAAPNVSRSVPLLLAGSAFRRRPRQRLDVRQLLAAPIIGAVAVLTLVVGPAVARADSPSTLTVVGTSDLSDSGLEPNLIQPEFNKAFPQFTLKYIGSATGAAIQSAENGNGGPSALIVHAPALENQFVASGYSYNNQYGNAIFTNDFVLAGPTGDPAGVASNAAHNIAQAFADIAIAGNSGTATFLSRGGTTTASGTTVEEHQLWALLHGSGLQPSSLVLCDVSAADGGGMTPIKATVQATSGQPCPDNGTVNSTDVPPWYAITGVSQAANVIEANACPSPPAPSGQPTCYVLSDRGTFDYLASGTDTAGAIPNLKIVTRDNGPSAPGGANELINYFHVYIINPSKPGETVNLTAAQDFFSFLTSQAFQSQLKTYLPTTDSGGPPFKADASPNLTESGLTKNYNAKKPMTVKGTVVNAEPGYPALSAETVNVQQIVGGVPLTVASGKTNSTGAYRIKFTPSSTGSYEVSTGQISKIEDVALTPPYGDILSPAATPPLKVKVHGATSSLRVESQGRKALVIGTVAPRTGHVKGTVIVFARAGGNTGGFKKVATDRLATTQGNFAISVPLAPGDWNVKVKFQDPKQGVVAATSRTVKVTITPAPASSISLHSVNGTDGGFTLAGDASPSGESGAKIELLRLNTTPGAPARFTVFGTANLGAGKDKVTFHATRIKHGTRWLLQLEYIRPRETPSFSAAKTVAIR
ncbi:MAG TPA: substrate-binding domain-containing protein [Solirubrobacteraceae bacterium]